MRNLIEKKRRLLELFVLSFITIFGIGSQFFSNLAYSLNQGVLQTSFGIGSEYLIIPSVVSNFAFAMGVPLGHIFTHRFGFKRNYLFFVFLFLLGSIMGLLSFDLVSLSIAKVTQSFSTGVLFFTLLPKLFITFPRRYRNVFLMMVVVGLFGANALGGLSGSLSLELDKWHWLFIINIISSMLCLLLGYFLLTKEEYLRKTETYISKSVITLLILSTLAIAFPMSILTHAGWESVLVWAPLLLAVLFIINFILFNARSEHPIIYFKSLLIKKPFVGAIMAIASHLTLLSGIAGINIYIIRILKLPFPISLRFYVFFFVGVLITGVVKMFFYSSVGAGILGTIGATSILFVSVNWLILGRVVNVSFLYLQ
ncbi:MFS transporter, partial [Staphylococcus aureus]|nr:MFS transporter [Staphylococcus aureus]